MLAGKEYFCSYLMRAKKVISNIENVCVAFENDPELKGKFSYNELYNTAMMKVNGILKPISDGDITDIQRYLQRHCMIETVTEKLVAQAVSSISCQNPYHPVRDYCRIVEEDYDGEKRLDGWLTRTLGVAYNQYTREAGEISLKQPVKRVTEPGCKADYILVLVGKQGLQKSTACRILFDPWFTDALPDITTKDGSMALSGVWGIEIAEMAAFLRHEGYASKAFTTRQIERYRVPYGRTVQEFGRQCVLFGTSNEPRFNADPTGGRRFFGVICGKEGESNINWLRANRDQLWGEAVTRYRADPNCYPSPEVEKEHFDQPQKDSQEYDELATNVIEYANEQTMPFTITKLFQQKFAHFSPIAVPIARRTAAILRQNGYEDYQDKGRLHWKKGDKKG